MKEIVFNSEQKVMLLEILKSRFGDKYDDAIYHQIYHDLNRTDKHFFTPKWSRAAWIVIFHSDKPKPSKEYELLHDLETRIREAWDKNETMQIIFR